MKCLNCDSSDTRVLDSRLSKTGIRTRRRECISCGLKFSTEERAVSTLLIVVKSDETREQFDIQKLRKGIELALHKRPISSDTVDQMISKIVKVFGNKGADEVRTSEIGELVMQYLGDIDRVAFIRFASVYRNFTDAQQFGDFAKQVSNVGESFEFSGEQQKLKYFFLDNDT